MNDIVGRTALAFLGILLILVSTISVYAQSKCYNEPSPMCKLPQLTPSAAEDGYVYANGTWTPDGLIDNADIDIECVRTSIPQFSDSKIGVCMLAAGFLFHGMGAVSTSDFGIVAWERTKIIAERDASWQMENCETQQLVLDFLSNTVTLTSTLSRSSGHCAKLQEMNDKTLREAHKPPQKDVDVFTLVHNLGALYADEDRNVFFNKKQ